MPEKITNHFYIHEYVDPETYEKLGEERSGNIISPYLFATVEMIRVNTGEKITINNWYWGGGYKYSGIRPKSSDVGSDFSTHRYCNTADLKFEDSSIKDIFDYIITHQHLYPQIIRIENPQHTPTWLHIECGRSRGGKDIYVFNP